MRECPDYFYQQSAVVPIRFHERRLQILMISSRKGKRWVIPKGVIEPDLSAEESAAKEAAEEAGIQGEILPGLLGSFQYEKWGDTCTVQVFVLQVNQVFEQWLEDFRSRMWLDLPEAKKRISEPALQELIEQLPLFLAGHGLP
ncbi:NUDIX hydrolase [Candidatus Magnetaquicoccus inordinatus]|uniref:NUDIX hydrolase n=1 Tax=Candidatus Magnetaquicoccus inordinatus TaxID=2496818 RepID=UPI00102CC2D1|nr:NUDIX domain-containing protein [Candidatus Magnetaquicoccus inordinatus]